jgi:hypothetical protein
MQKRTALRAFPGMSCRVDAQGPGPARGLSLAGRWMQFGWGGTGLAW